MDQSTYPKDLQWLMDNRSYKRCTKCKTGYLDTRIKRAVIVKCMFFWADLKRYRCNNCYATFYLRTNRE